MGQRSLQSGEFLVNGNVIRTASRLREYLKARPSKRSPVIFHVIQPEYCEMLMINPDDMVAINVSDQWADILQKQIAEHFQRLPVSDPLSDRIFKAHAETYFRMEPVMQFVKEAFFAKRP